MQVIELEVSNVKRIRAVHFAPRAGAHLVVVQGPNGAGKTSVLDAIAYAIGGQRLVCSEPLRTGASSGFARVDLGDVAVLRRWTRNPHTGAVTSTLEVRGRDGVRVARAQAALDGLFAALSFDPLDFVRQPASAQLELARKLAGVDFDELDRLRASLFADRTELGRRMRGADEECARRPVLEGLPAEPVSIAALSAEVEAAAASQSAAARAGEAAAWSLQLRATTEAARDRVRKQLVELALREAELVLEWEQQTRELETLQAAAARLAEQAVDPEPVRKRLADAERTNARIRENQGRAQLLERAAALRAEYRELDQRIAGIDLEKEHRVAAAELPVPGLTFRHDGLLLDGVPFEQSSQAQQIRVSVAMGAALHPTLRVLLVRDGSLLGEQALELLGQLAAERDLQVWVERVGEPGEGESTGDVLVIEDGEAVEAAA